MKLNCRQNINLAWIITLVLMICTQSSLRADTDVNHIVIKLNGNALVTRIDSMNSDNMYLTDPKSGANSVLPLKSVYLAFNDFNRLFYLSPSFMDRIAYLEDWGGTLETLEGKTYNYTSIRYNRTMKKPEMYLVLESDSARGISLFDVYKIKADNSATELSVIRGFKASAGLILLGTGIDILKYYFKNKDAGILSTRTLAVMGKGAAVEGAHLMPGYGFLGIKKNGVTYHSLVFGIPATTMGWMVYDTVRDRRASYFIPRDGTTEYPRNMYFFNPNRIYADWKSRTKAKIKSKIPPFPKIPFLSK